MPFLTDLDSRAAVKGSRDPLGIQQIWTRLGRHVVGNLTTVSTSVRDYATLLLGYHFAEQVAEHAGPGSELATFMKWEQLAAYCRARCNSDFVFRGTEKVQRILSEGTRICLSADRNHQILSNDRPGLRRRAIPATARRIDRSTREPDPRPAATESGPAGYREG